MALSQKGRFPVLYDHHKIVSIIYMQLLMILFIFPGNQRW
jgi:hypothetical protein